MDIIRQLAFASVVRGCAFASLGIFTTVIGLLGTPVTALRTGAVLTLVMALVLLLRAERAPHVDHRRTEVWLMLPEDRRPPGPVAQTMTARALREAYLALARHAAAAAVLQFVASLVFALAQADLG